MTAKMREKAREYINEFTEFKVRQLQKLDRLLQLRRHHQLLALSKLEFGVDRHYPTLTLGLCETNGANIVYASLANIFPRYTLRTSSFAMIS